MIQAKQEDNPREIDVPLEPTANSANPTAGVSPALKTVYTFLRNLCRYDGQEIYYNRYSLGKTHVSPTIQLGLPELVLHHIHQRLYHTSKRDINVRSSLCDVE